MSGLIVTTSHQFSADRSLTTITIKGLARFEPAEFFFEVAGPDAPRSAPNGNVAIAAVLPIAMSRGLPVHYEGEADSDFLRNIEECMAAWCRWRPDLFQPVPLTVEREASPRLPDLRRAMIAFSGGLDSTFALHAHKRGLMGRRNLNVDAAMLVHGFDIPLASARAFEIARNHNQAILDSYGVRLNIVRTDWKKRFCVKWGMTHILGLSAILQLFNRDFSAGVFADDFAYDAQWMPWSNNPVTNQMLGGTAFEIRSTGASWSRTEKAAVLADNPVALEHLRVCYEHPDLGGNCGQCGKCVRTKINFYACGVKAVPALGAQIVASDVEVLRPLNAESVLWYEDALAKGVWPQGDPIRLPVEALVNEYKAGEVRSKTALGVRKQSAFRRLRKPLKSAQRAILHFIGLHRRS